MWKPHKNQQRSKKVNITQNKKAKFDYEIIETEEAGIVLSGTEVKSCRQGNVTIKDSFAKVENGEVFIYNLHISPYLYGNRFNLDPKRVRKLLLHKYQIKRLIGKTQGVGLTLIPLRLYFKKGKVKVEIALGKGRKIYDKRREILKKEVKREMRKYSARI